MRREREERTKKIKEDERIKEIGWRREKIREDRTTPWK
jgi:hypothetical protein